MHAFSLFPKFYVKIKVHDIDKQYNHVPRVSPIFYDYVPHRNMSGLYKTRAYTLTDEVDKQRHFKRFYTTDHPINGILSLHFDKISAKVNTFLRAPEGFTVLEVTFCFLFLVGKHAQTIMNYLLGKNSTS